MSDKMGKSKGNLAASQVGIVAALVAFLSTPIRADVITFELYDVLSGASPSAGGPWATAVFTDLEPGLVQLAMTANLSGDGEEIEKITEWFFNLNPGLAYGATRLSFNYQSGNVAERDIEIFKTDDNDIRADGLGFFDILFAFEKKNKKAFSGTDSIVYEIAGPEGSLLTAADFNYEGPSISVPVGETVAKVQGIPPAPGESGWIGPGGEPVPEPATLILLGFGLAGLGFFARRNHKAQS